MEIRSHGSTDFNVGQYRRTVTNMLWINRVLFVCYLPYLASLLTILAIELSDTTRFVLHFSATVIYLNSSLNPILYCWKIKELRERYCPFAMFARAAQLLIISCAVS